MTEWERKLWYLYLKNYKIKFLRQKTIGSYITDFCCVDAKIIVELDGKWHQTGEHSEYDLNRQKYLENNGFKVLRFKNKEISYEFEKVCKTIDMNVKERLGLDSN